MKIGELGCLFGVYTEDYVSLIKKQAITENKYTNVPVKGKVKFKKSGKTYPKKTR